MAKHSEFNQIVDGIYNATELAVADFKTLLRDYLASLSDELEGRMKLDKVEIKIAGILGRFLTATNELKTPAHARAALRELKRGVLYDGSKN